jgi:hypothetical protein
VTATVSTLALEAVLTLSIFMGLLALIFWHVQREEPTSFWLAAWLVACAIFAFSRLMQYATLSDSRYIVAARIVLTVGYSLAWLGYEFANSFLVYHPPRWERSLMIILTALPIIFLWTSSFILTNEVVIRRPPFSGEFHGVVAGFLYLPVSLLILALGMVPPLRLIKAKNSHRRENLLLAMGYLFVILFSLNDIIATSLSLHWIRLSDFSYMPVAILFSYIQVGRYAQLYKDLNGQVRARTAELSQANETLRSEIAERRHAELEAAAIAEVGRDISTSLQLGIVLERIASHARILLDAVTGAVYLTEPDATTLRAIAAIGPDADEIKHDPLNIGEGILGIIAYRKKGEIVNNTNSDPRAITIIGTEVTPDEHLMGVPLLSRDRLTGLIAV